MGFPDCSYSCQLVWWEKSSETFIFSGKNNSKPWFPLDWQSFNPAIYDHICWWNPSVSPRISNFDCDYSLCVGYMLWHIYMFLNISYNLQSLICVGHYGLHPFSQRPLRSPRQTGWSVLDVEEATAGNFPRPDPDLNAPDLVWPPKFFQSGTNNYRCNPIFMIFLIKVGKIFQQLIYKLYSGWWFGTFWNIFLFSISYMGCHPEPIDELIFFRGVQTTNQLC